MGIIATVDHTRQRVVVRTEGTITLDDVLAHLEEERREAGLSYSELIDGRGSIPALSSADVRAIVDALSRVAKESRLGPTAILVDTDLAYGLLRMLEILVEDVCAVRPFRHQEEAEKWLADVGEGV